MYIVRKYKIYLYELYKQVESDSLAIFSSLFHSECKFILYLTTMYVYCVYTAISKSPQQLSNCLKISETSAVLIVFNDVICDVSTCMLPFLPVALVNQVPAMLY